MLLDPDTRQPTAGTLSAPDGSWTTIELADQHSTHRVTEAGTTPLWAVVDHRNATSAGRPVHHATTPPGSSDQTTGVPPRQSPKVVSGHHHHQPPATGAEGDTMPEPALAGPHQDMLTWLLAEYAETEEAATEAALDDVPGWEIRSGGTVMGTDPRYHSMIIEQSVEPTPCQRWHIVRNDPQTVLADTAAKRDIITQLLADTTPEGQHRAHRVIHRFAAALAHRPGYQPDWAPIPTNE
jgi:hypothetical protein